MKDKIKLDIIGISNSQTQTGAYALILGEEEGQRRLPIIIGGFEAQSIAIELENMHPNRPLTHDLFRNFAEAFNITLNEVVINKFQEGVFYAQLVCFSDEGQKIIDARTSDAVALAVRFKAPIFTYEEVMSKAGILIEEEKEKTSETE
ncbi:MAG: bifunctional nuclease family protein, partial [Bacteroidota bacterium]